MRKFIRGYRMVLLCCVLVCCAILASPISVRAIDLENNPYIVLEKYSITKEKIVPGEPFVLDLTFKNYSMNATAKNVLVDVVNPDGVAPAYGTISQAWIEELGPNEIKTIPFEYTTSANLSGEYKDFVINMIGDVTNTITLRAPLGSDFPFSVLDVKFPNKVGMKSGASATVAFRVLGEGSVKNIVLEVIANDKTIGRSEIGTLTAGSTRNQSISLTGMTLGQMNAELVVYYDDEDDQTRRVVVGTSVVEVFDDTQQENAQNAQDMEIANSDASRQKDIVLLGVGGILILCIFTVVFIVFRKKR